MLRNNYLEIRSLVGLFVLSACFLLGIASSGVAQGKKKKGKAKATATATSNASARKPSSGKGGIRPYRSVITKDAKSDPGLFTFHKVGNKYYYEIPKDLLEREMLIVSRIAATIQNLNFGGAGMKSRPQQVVRWQKKDNKILLRSVSFSSVASEEQPIYQSVKNNNFEPIVMSFDIKAMKEDSSAYVIDIAPLFTTDVAMIGALNGRQRRAFKVKALDKNRSLISRIRSYPENIEVRHILTYRADAPPSNRLTNAISLEMNQSMILLPEDKMQPRLFDQRVGYFSIAQTNYSDEYQVATEKRYITRWRLDPKDPEAFRRGELVEPVKPIVYYIDPATPMKWRPFLKKGVEDWNAAFEVAGFKNAILCKEPPSPEEDPEFSPEDVRYSVIRYTANSIQNAQGPHVHDPRTGEILESDIIWYHNVANLLRNWFFVQTAAVNPDARKVKFEDKVMGELIRFVAAHEVGHTLGFPHNMGASSSYPVDSLRSATFTQKMGTAPSIMDYARFNYVAQPGDEGVALMPGIGVYDKYATMWGYRPILEANSPESERITLNKWVRDHEDNPMYRFGKQMSLPLDPTSQTEDLGDNAMKASEYGIQNLKRIIPNLIQWTAEDGKNFEDLNELYGQVITQWNRYMRHVATNVGGVYEFYQTYDQNKPVYTHVEKAKQKAAIQFLNVQAFQTPEWMIHGDILSRIESAGVVNRIRAYQARLLGTLLDFSRLARIIENETINGDKAYACMEMMNDLRGEIWKETRNGQKVDTYRRNLQRAYVEQLEMLYTQEQNRLPRGAERRFAYTPVDVSQSDIRPLARAEMKKVQTLMKKGLYIQDEITRAHYEELLARVNQVLDPK